MWEGGMRGPVPESRMVLTTEERILLYMSEFRGMEERFELPLALTQKSIAFAAGIHRKHVSRYLDGLVAEGAIAERKAHIEGMKQRMLAYHLSGNGWDRAKRIREHLATVRVPIRVGGEAKEMTLAEIDKATSVRLTFSDIVREAMEVDTLDLAHLEGIDERRRRAMDERLKKLEAYARAIMTAWKDGRVSATERLLVEQLREHLGVSREEHERIETQVMEEVLSNRQGIYRAVAEEALEDGPVRGDERELLEALRKKLGISVEECQRIEADATRKG